MYILLALLSTLAATAQVDTTQVDTTQVDITQDKTLQVYRNGLKLNAMGLVFHNVSLLYERSLNEHLTLQVGTGYRWGGDLPKVFGLGDLIVSSNTRGLRGYHITPELRYYFNFCECGDSPAGFYTGLYTRYTQYYGDLNFHFWTGTEYMDAAVVSNISEMGAGIQLGYQFVFKKRFSVDFMFAGPRFSTYRLKCSIDSDYAAELAPIIEEEINRRLEWLGMDPITISPSAEIDTRVGFRNFRYAVSFGFMF